MGAGKSKTKNIDIKMYQHQKYIDHCRKYPSNFELTFDTKINDSIDSLIMSAGAHAGTRINHLLDGYSWSVVLSLVNGKIKLISKQVDIDQELYESEEAGNRLKSGLFTSDMPMAKKILFGNAFKYATGHLAIERTTAHQPIYFPYTDEILFCSAIKYHSFKNNITSIFSEKNIIENRRHRLESKPNIKYENDQNNQVKFPEKEYTCMHPHYDIHKKELLTYSFKFSVMKERTDITFYSFNAHSHSPSEIKYSIDQRIALHMFGFTPNYYIIFANPLKMVSGGQTKVVYGEPLLRMLDDNFVSDLVIHFIPRNKDRSPFSINTKKKGFVYHSINCYEKGNKIVIDAFVSELNPRREASQFELSPEEDVHDNCGDPYRFEIIIPELSDEYSCKTKLICSLIDSTIDFHCINTNYTGQHHKYIWIVGHERKRDLFGKVSSVTSRLSKILISDSGLNFISESTLEVSITEDNTYYRTPLFIPNKDPLSEDDGYIFVWTYEEENNKVNILFYNARDLSLIDKIKIPTEYNIPYSVHSWIYHKLQ